MDLRHVTMNTKKPIIANNTGMTSMYKCNLIYLIGIDFGAKNNKPLINAMISAITNSENSN